MHVYYVLSSVHSTCTGINAGMRLGRVAVCDQAKRSVTRHFIPVPITRSGRNPWLANGYKMGRSGPFA